MKSVLKKLSIVFAFAFAIISCGDDDNNENTLPLAEVEITATTDSSQTLNAKTQAVDIDEDKVTFTYQWYRADDATGTNEKPIKDATKKTYTFTIDDSRKFIMVKVTPNDGKGDGEEAKSTYYEVDEVIATRSVLL